MAAMMTSVAKIALHLADGIGLCVEVARQLEEEGQKEYDVPYEVASTGLDVVL